MEYLEPDLDDAPAPPKEKMEKKPPAEPKEKKAKKSIFEAGDISSYVASQLVTLLEKHIRKAWHSITDIELASLRLHECAFGKGSGMNGQAHCLEKFFTDRVENWRSLAGYKPTILLLSASAIRCVELLKYLPNVRQRCTIAKLFAKHIKLAEQKGFLASHASPIAVGTPARILKLGLEEDIPIDFEKVDTIIVDTHRDAKDRTVFDVPEIRKELLGLLCKTTLRDRLNDGDCQLLFF